MKLAAALLILAAPAFGQHSLNYPTHAACAAAAASVVGPAGGTAYCSTTSTKAVLVPVSITAHGAKCDGSDDHAAITRAIAAAKAKSLPVLIPAGTCAYGDVIDLDGVKLMGTGDASELYALNPLRAAINLLGSGSEVRNLRLTGMARTRSAARTSSRIVPIGATKWVIDGVLIDNAAGAGIQTAMAANNGTISNNRINNTLADSIHITERSNYITITGNKITNSGDDGIGVVSYKTQLSPVHHITAKNNTISDNKWGRSMSVVGGQDVVYENNRMANNPFAACAYFAQESSYNTFPVRNISVRYNTLIGCGNPSIGHAAVMLFTSITGEPNTNVALTRNDISQSARGIRVFGNNTGVVLDSNKIDSQIPLQIQIEGVKVVPWASGLVGVQ